MLDLHFRPHDHAERPERDILGAVTSTGILEVYSVESETSRAQFLHRFRIASDDTVLFSLAWRPSSQGTIALTLSNLWTVLCILSINEKPSSETDSNSPIAPSETWLLGRHTDDSMMLAPEVSSLEQIHTQYPWMAVWDADGSTLFVGDDDAQFSANTIPDTHSLNTRQTQNEISEDYTVQSLSWDRRRGHEAGITAILPLGDFVITGSYDYHLRIFSRKGDRKLLADAKFDETLWRLKFMGKPQGDFTRSGNEGGEANMTLLASCMRDGTRVLAIKRQSDKWDIQERAQFTNYAEHINYASDVQPRTTEDKEYRIVSISFYGKKLCLWKWSDVM